MTDGTQQCKERQPTAGLPPFLCGIQSAPTAARGNCFQNGNYHPDYTGCALLSARFQPSRQITPRKPEGAEVGANNKLGDWVNV